MAPRSNSSASVGWVDRLRYWRALYRTRAGMVAGEDAALKLLAEVRHYVAEFERETGLAASDCTVLEIGFGARPRRAFALTGFFDRVIAIDLDHPVLSASDAIRTTLRNGPARGLKSLARYLLFDRTDNRAFEQVMRRELQSYDPGRAELRVGSASNEEVWNGLTGVECILSFDVIEHMPPDDLARCLGLLRDHLAPGGLAILRPMVFTGISGGHVPEWYPPRVDDGDPSRAWRHLDDPTFAVDTYLNRLTRREFVEAFANSALSMTRDHARFGRLGEQHLTDARRRQLTAFDDYELFSNHVEFYLRA